MSLDLFSTMSLLDGYGEDDLKEVHGRLYQKKSKTYFLPAGMLIRHRSRSGLIILYSDDVEFNRL